MQRLGRDRRLLQIIAAVLCIAGLLVCAERLHASIGVWGVFVVWAVAAFVAVVWPMAFLVTGFGAARKDSRAVLLTAVGLTLSGLGLLQVGWGLVMMLNPEYTVGWYIPSRTGGTEISDAAEALLMGRLMVGIGVLVVAGALAITVAIARDAPGPEPRTGTNEEHAGIATQMYWAGCLLLWPCAALFWIIALGIGLISMIQYDGVRRRLAECTPGAEGCSTDIGVANDLPWVLAAASALALLGLLAAFLGRNSLPLVSSLGERLRATLMLVATVIYHAGSVLAIASAVLYARWSDATCTGRGPSRACGEQHPGFSFAEEWTAWATAWALITYAVLASLLVFGLLAWTQSELAARGTSTRAGAGGSGAGTPGSSGPRVVVYLLSVAAVSGAIWTGISSWQLSSVPSESAGSWDEYTADTMNPSMYPHLEEVGIEIPTGHDPDSVVLVQISLVGDEPEMPSAEVEGLVDAACAYDVSPWRASVPESWVNVSYGSEGDSTRFVRVDCGSGHRRAAGDLLAWMEQHPAGGAVDEISIKSRDDGALETQLYLADTSTASFEAAIAHLCAFPATEEVQRSGTIFDGAAFREVGDIDCDDPDAALAEWRSQE